MQAVISMYSWIMNRMNKLNFQQANIEYELKFLKENMEVSYYDVSKQKHLELSFQTQLS